MKKPDKAIRNLRIYLAVLFALLLVSLLLLSFDLGFSASLKRMGSALLPVFVLVVVVVIAVRYNNKMNKEGQILQLQDPDERIQKLQELWESGYYLNRQMNYYNNLSVCYFDKEEYEQALAAIRTAKEIQAQPQTKVKELRIGPATTTADLLWLNEILYLLSLDRLEEASQLLGQANETRLKSNMNLFLFFHHQTWLALRKGDAALAKQYLAQLNGPSFAGMLQKNPQPVYSLYLLQAECDLLENNRTSAALLLDDIIEHGTNLSTVNRAKQLRDTLL